MLFNKLLKCSQNFFEPFVKNSLVLKSIDSLIFLNIVFLIFGLTFLQSDNIAIFAIFVIVLTIVKLLTKSGERFQLTVAEKFLLVYFMIMIISVAGSSLFLYSFKGFCKTFIYIGFYVSLVHYLTKNRKMLKYILLSIAVACFGESLIAIYQNFMSVSEISGWQDVTRLNPEEVMTRVYGSLKPYNPNLFGGYLLAVIPSTLTLLFLPLKNKHYKTASLGAFMFLLGCISIFLTGCRGAYIGLFFEVVILMFFVYRFLKPFYKKIFALISSVVGIITCLIILSVTSLRARIFSIFAMRNDSSNSFRFNVYNSCINMFKDNWLLGIGVGNQNFREIYGLYMKTGFDALSAYNIYLEIAVESGIFSLIAFLCFIFMNIYKAFKYMLTRKNLNTIYILIALTSIIGILIHGFVDTVFFRPQIQFIFWTMICILRVLTTKRCIEIND